MHNDFNSFKTTTTDLLTKLHSCLQRLSQAPVLTPRVRIRDRDGRIDTNEEEQVEAGLVRATRQTLDSRAVLCKRPKSLHVVWHEYEFGVGGKKAAKLFTHEERGRNKFTYCLRKPFWELVEDMIRHGYNHNTAIDKIEDEHRNMTVTATLQAIKKARRQQLSGGGSQIVIREFLVADI